MWKPDAASLPQGRHEADALQAGGWFAIKDEHARATAGGQVMWVILVDDYPNGHENPFDPATRSGTVLRKMVEEIGLGVSFFDLWDAAAEEGGRRVTSGDP